MSLRSAVASPGLDFLGSKTKVFHSSSVVAQTQLMSACDGAGREQGAVSLLFLGHSLDGQELLRTIVWVGWWQAANL